MEQHRVVITGLGIYSCLGSTLDEVRDALYNGKSGIIFDPERKAMGFRSALTAKLVEPDLRKELSRSQRVFMPEQAKYAYCATRDALRNAGIDQDYLNSHEVGLLMEMTVLPCLLSMLLILCVRRRTRLSAARVLSSSQ